jgi:hypothetical protein
LFRPGYALPTAQAGPSDHSFDKTPLTTRLQSPGNYLDFENFGKNLAFLHSKLLNKEKIENI